MLFFLFMLKSTTLRSRVQYSKYCTLLVQSDCRYFMRWRKKVMHSTYLLSYKLLFIARKGVPAPLLRHPPLDPACPHPLSKIFVSPPLISVPPPFSGISGSSPTLTQPSCPNRNNKPSLHIINLFKQISKG